jgi:hypothetical protein
MDEIDIALTDIRIQIQSIQCRIVNNELNVIHDKLSIIEAWLRDNPPDIFEMNSEDASRPSLPSNDTSGNQTHVDGAYISPQPQPGFQRKKRRLY